MKLKDFLAVASGIEEYTLSGKYLHIMFEPGDQDRIIEKYGNCKVEYIYFSVDTCDQKCCDIYVRR